MIAKRLLILVCAGVFGLLILAALPALAQTTVSDDDVNAVAQRLYCPVCANVPLDVCNTLACSQWRDEIRADLASGKTPDEIVAKFVAQFGQRVVGTPEDPGLRALSLVTPFLLAGVVLAVGALTVLRWRRTHVKPALTPPDDPVRADGDAALRAQLEADLSEQR